MNAGLGSDTYNHLIGVAQSQKINIHNVSTEAHSELLNAAERCCEARRLAEGVGINEADLALRTLLSRFQV